MPTSEQFQMWAEEVATAAAPFGEAASVAAGTPEITCAYLINLLNRLLLQIAMDTALSGMTGQEAQAYRDLQVLRSRIIRACDPTQAPQQPDAEVPEPEEQEEPEPDDELPPPEPPLWEEPHPPEPVGPDPAA